MLLKDSPNWQPPTRHSQTISEQLGGFTQVLLSELTQAVSQLRFGNRWKDKAIQITLQGH